MNDSAPKHGVYHQLRQLIRFPVVLETVLLQQNSLRPTSLWKYTINLLVAR